MKKASHVFTFRLPFFQPLFPSLVWCQCRNGAGGGGGSASYQNGAGELGGDPAAHESLLCDQFLLHGAPEISVRATTWDSGSLRLKVVLGGALGGLPVLPKNPRCRHVYRVALVWTLTNFNPTKPFSMR